MGTILLLIIILPRELTSLRFAKLIYLPDESPSRWLAIVFGAGLRRNGTPSAVLGDRVRTAVQLYKEDKISKILMSGSTNDLHHDEAAAMKNMAVQLGVDPEDILMDQGGTRTFETCRRAKEVFNVDNVILVSQSFHLPRALSICHAMGLDAIGVSADLRSYGSFSAKFWQLREIPATFVALWEAYLLPFTEKEAMNPNENEIILE